MVYRRFNRTRRFGRRRTSKMKPLMYAKRKTIKNIVRVGESLSKRSLIKNFNAVAVGTGGVGFCFFGADPALVTTANTFPEIGSAAGYDNARLSSTIFVTGVELNVNLAPADFTNRLRVVICRSIGGFLGSDLSNFMIDTSVPSFDYINQAMNTGTVFVYYDRTFTLAESTTYNRSRELKVIMKCPCELDYKKYNPTGPTTESNKVDKPFYILFISDSGVAPFPQVRGYARFWYNSV